MSGTTDMPLTMAVQTELAQLQALLKSVSSSKVTPITTHTVFESESVGLVLRKTVDASQPAPRSTPSRPSPRLVSWSPDGRYLVTACGAWGCTFWDVEDRFSSPWRYHPPSCYGEAEGVMWSRSGDRFLLNGGTARASYVEIFESFRGHSPGSPPRSLADWSFSSSYIILRDLYRAGVQPFEPWRPGTADLLIPDGQSLKLVDETRIRIKPELPQAVGCAAMLGRVLIDSVRPSGAKEPEGLLAAQRSSIDLKPLGAMDVKVLGFTWHPSGQFVAVTTAADWRSASRVHILHFDSARVLASIPDATTRGWNQGGGLLLLESSKFLTGPDPSRKFLAWDASSSETRELTEEEKNSVDFARKIASIESGCRANASGEWILRDDSEGLQIVHRSTQRVLGSLPQQIKDAAWSPTDPCSLATVGGADAPDCLRLWTLSS